jgi:hypothetical protein
LESAFLIKKISRLNQTANKLKRETTFKLYLTNPSMRTALFGAIKEDDKFMGNMVENAIFSQIMHLDYIDRTFYANWKKGEVDLVIKNKELTGFDEICEIKWSNRYIKNQNDLDGLIYFYYKNIKKMANPNCSIFTTTKNKYCFMNNLNIRFVENCIYCFYKNVETLKRINSGIHPLTLEKLDK